MFSFNFYWEFYDETIIYTIISLLIFITIIITSGVPHTTYSGPETERNRRRRRSHIRNTFDGPTNRNPTTDVEELFCDLYWERDATSWHSGSNPRIYQGFSSEDSSLIRPDTTESYNRCILLDRQIVDRWIDGHF